MSTISSTSSSSYSIPQSETISRLTLSDWIRHKKCDLRPESRINAFKLQARQSIDNNNFEDAINFYTRALELNYNHLSLYMNRSFCYEKLNKYELSLSDAQKVIDFSDHKSKSKINNEDAHRYRNKLGFVRKGRALKALDRFQEAIDAFNQANKLAISCPFIHNEVRGIKIQVINRLGYDRTDIELICDQFDRIEDIIKQLNRNKELMVKNESELMPTNPFKYRSLYVNGLRSDCDHQEFEQLMSSCGQVLRCKVYSNGIQSKAVITFIDEQSVREAVKKIRLNNQLVRDQNLLVIRFRHTWLEEGSDPQLNFKGDEIAGECYKWRTSGCDDKECNLLHIAICHHLDQQNVETESAKKDVKHKRTPIKFDIDVNLSENGVDLDEQNVKNNDSQNIDSFKNNVRRKRTPIKFDIDVLKDEVNLDQNNVERDSLKKTFKRKRTSIEFDFGLPQVEVDLPKIEVNKKLKCDLTSNNRSLTSYDDLFD